VKHPRITGQFDISLLLPVVVGLIYAGTGGWSAERWNTALAVMGLSVAKRSYDQGYWTENPELRKPPAGIEHPRDDHGRFTRKDQ
jgi:hypothetical protein